MNKPDLTDIDPLKWSEVRRRIEAVTCYLDLARPTATDRQLYASILGLGVQQFGNLIKAWRAHGTAMSLVPGWRPVRKSKSKNGGVDPRARKIARDVIAQKHESAELPALVRIINEQCAIAGIAPPSTSTVWLLKKERSRANPEQLHHSIIIGRAYLRLPIEQGGRTEMPEATILVEAPTGRIVDILFSWTGACDYGEQLTSVISNAFGSGAFPIAAPEFEASVIRDAFDQIKVTAVTPARAKRMLSDLLGKRIGRIRLNFRSLKLQPAAVMESGKDRPLNLEDAKTAVSIAIERHNNDLALPT